MQYTFEGRYADILKSVLDNLGAVEELRVNFEDDYQGFVDVDVLLSDDRVFSYMYNYGSCSGCDEWEDRGLSDSEIEEEMLSEAAIFDTREEYQKWRDTIKKPDSAWIPMIGFSSAD